MPPAAEPTRQLRVFVSSTFRDMQPERDYLVSHVFPQLRKLCESRMVTWGEVDLRWGIPDEDSDQVLNLCLQEIGHCRPYFIGMLGARYGYVPGKIEDAAADQFPWLREHRGKSITELELVHGILRDESSKGHGFVYFRDPSADVGTQQQHDPPEHTQNLNDLKDTIREAHRKGLCALQEDYKNPEELGQWVLEDFTRLIDDRFPEEMVPHPLEQVAVDHVSMSHRYARVFVGREQYLEALDEHVSSEGPPLVVVGESGVGKSALLANWFARRHPDEQEFVLIHFAGGTPDSTDPVKILRRIMAELKDRYSEVGFEELPAQPEEVLAAFPNWLVRIPRDRTVVLALDGLDQLEDRGAALDLGWLPVSFPTNCRLILSTGPGRPLDETRRRDWPELPIALLNTEERTAVLEAHLAQYSRRLSRDHIAQIVSAPQTGNALFLTAMLDELRQFGEHERLTEQIEYYLGAADPRALYKQIILRWQDRYGDAFVEQALSLIWGARRGLSETELRDLIGQNGEPLPSLHWTPFYLAAESSFAHHAGLLTFAHPHLRNAVSEAYLPSEIDRRRAHLRLADYFSGRVLQGKRETDEIPWQLVGAAEWSRLADLLADLSFVYVTYVSNSPYDLLRYWAELESQGDFEMAGAYEPVVGNPEAFEPKVVQLVASLLAWGHPDKASTLYASVLRRYDKVGDAPEGLATALYTQAVLLRRQGDNDTALSLLVELEQLSRRENDRADLAASLSIQGMIHRDRGDLESAGKLLREQESIARELNSDYLLGMSLGAQGSVLEAAGDFDGALSLYEEQARLCRKLGPGGELQAALGNLANIRNRRGELEVAYELYSEEEAVGRTAGDRAAIAAGLGGRAMVLRQQGDYEGAMRLHAEEEKTYRSVGFVRGIATSVGNQANILLERDEWEAALKLLEEQQRICREIGDRVGLADSLGKLALIERRRGDPGRAFEVLDERARLYLDLNDADGLLATMSEQAGILQKAGLLDNAANLLARVKDLARQLGNNNILEHTLRNEGLILLAGGDAAGAMELQQEAERVCRESGSLEGLAACQANQALILAQQGQLREAAELIERVRQLAVKHGFESVLRQLQQLMQLLASGER